MAFSLSHIELYVSDLDRASQFWGWLFEFMGYRLCHTWLQGRSYAKDGHYFCIVQAPEKHAQAGYHRCRPGLNHLAFEATSKEEVIALRAALIERDVPLLYEDRYPYASGDHLHAVFFEDPDRMKIEVTAPLVSPP